MDSHKWRRELDRFSEVKAMIVSINPTLEDQTGRQLRQLYDTFANLTKYEKEADDAGFMKKRKLVTQIEKVEETLGNDFKNVVRDFSDLFRKEQRELVTILPKIQSIKPADAKALASISFPSIGSGDMEDFERLYNFADAFSKRYVTVNNDIGRDTKDRLDENKRIVETYERYITIDRGEVVTTVSNEDVSGLPLSEIMFLSEKLNNEQVYLDGRKDEVGRMLGASVMSEIESLQATVETATRFGLDLPMDFSQKLRVLARDASRATDLTTLLSLENQMQTARLQMMNMLRDRIINMKHEVTSKIVEGGIPITAEVIPEAPVLAVENQEIPGLLSSYQKMAEWEGQVKIALKEEIEVILDDIEKATDVPNDTGIKDLVTVREFLAGSKKTLKKADIDVMVTMYSKAKSMDDDHRKNVTDTIRGYLTRFNELATSADRVLDYAQLSKKAPKVDELEGSIVYLLQSLTNLRQAVESGVNTFREACEQEIDAIIEDLQTIKPAYAEIFLPTIVDLDDGSAKIQKMDEFAKIRSEMRTIKETVLVKAQDALENLRYRLGVKIRLAAAKLMGAGATIPDEVQSAITELNNVAIAADTVFSLPAIARKMIELYEKRITGKIVEQLNIQAGELLDSFLKAASIGVPLKKEIKVLTKLKEDPPEELEDAADAFDQLATLTTSPKIQEKIRTRADDAYVQIKGAVSIFDEQGMPEFVERLKTLLEQVPDKMKEDSKYVNEALEVCLTLASIQDEMLGVIKNIASKDAISHDEEIKKKSKYHSTIERVYLNHSKDFSKQIYPLDRLKQLEGELETAEQLDVALEHFTEIKELRDNWVEKASKMDDWHKSMKMFMTGFSPTASNDERTKFLDDAIRKIKETYSRDDISSYLTW
ncbi:MAG: hypothetical protein ACTSU3_03390, partial [Candidatus Thorarchaeota archaeon]